MMTKSSKLPLFLALFLALSAWLISTLEAKTGKVFFHNGNWVKGDIQVQTGPDGREIVVLAMPSGSMILDRSEIKQIVYNSVQKSKNNGFLSAVEKIRTEKSLSRTYTPYEEYILMASDRHNLDPELVRAVIKQESNFNRRDVSNKGAQGLMQLMPETARGLGVQDAFDPAQNIHGGTLYLKYMLEQFNGDIKKALAAYNAGPYAVQKYGTIPPYRETREYVKKVMKYYEMYRGNKLFSFKGENGSMVITDQPYMP